MRKSGKLLCKIMPNLIVPLDSALIFLLYAPYYTTLRRF